jgi:hypothetical protein
MTPATLAMRIKEAGRRLGFDRVAVGSRRLRPSTARPSIAVSTPATPDA